MHGSRPHLVIIGGGFGGLSAARSLAHAPLSITLVDRRNHHLFQPLLYQVATASLAAPAIAAPLRQMLRKQANLEVLLDEALAVDPDARRVTLRDGRYLDYDFLILASGATHAYFGHDDWQPYAPGLKTLDDALIMRRRILLAFEYAERSADPGQCQAWLSFVVIGGGPTGVELAGTLAELAHHTLQREYRRINTHTVRVVLAEAGPRLLPGYDPILSDKAAAQLRRLGVDVRLGNPVTAVDHERVVLGGQRVAARTVLWAAGVAASPLGRSLDAPRDRVGRVQVGPDLSLPNHAEIFVIGDLASIQRADGKPVPGIAPAAKQMGKFVAKVLRRRLRNRRQPKQFVYHDQGALATIGRGAAVAQWGRLRLSGNIAWWTWLWAHVYFLIGFRNRLVVMLDWAWAYCTWQRHARIVTSPDQREPDIDTNAAPASRRADTRLP